MGRRPKDLNRETKAWLEYAELSNYLFKDDAPYCLNEIPSDHKFYQPARQMAEELEIGWESMTQDESNRIMINLLGDFYMTIQENKGEGYTMDIIVRKTQSEKEEE